MQDGNGSNLMRPCSHALTRADPATGARRFCGSSPPPDGRLKFSSLRRSVALGEVEFIGHGAHIDRPEAPRSPPPPPPRGSSRAGSGRHETMGKVVLQVKSLATV